MAYCNTWVSTVCYCQTSDLSVTKFQNLNLSHLVLQLQGCHGFGRKKIPDLSLTANTNSSHCHDTYPVVIICNISQIWRSHSSSTNNHLHYLLVYDGNVNIVSVCHSNQVYVATWCLVLPVSLNIYQTMQMNETQSLVENNRFEIKNETEDQGQSITKSKGTLIVLRGIFCPNLEILTSTNSN